MYNVPAGGLQIIKSDADTGERLGGVKFEIRKINGEILGTYTTDRDGVISIPNAESGWYTIVERKAKDGYALDTTPVNACVKDTKSSIVPMLVASISMSGRRQRPPGSLPSVASIPRRCRRPDIDLE